MSPRDPARESRAWAERIFRVSGLLPLAAFTVLHVAAYSVSPSDSHGFASGWLGLGLETALVLAPLVYHSGYGLFLLLQSERQATSTLVQVQRWTSPLLLLFLVEHVYRLRWPLLSGQAAPEDTHALLVRELSSTWAGVPVVATLQCLGITLLAFHLGFGLYRFDFEPVRALAAPRTRAFLGACVGLFVLLAGAFSIIELATGKTFPFV